MPRPVVGLSIGALTAERLERQRPLREALHRAGAVPILLRPGEGAAALGRVHGLCLAGGGDIEPYRYGAQETAEVRDRDPERDEAELALARAALEGAVPTLGICRGLQVMVVAAGGALVQHIPEVPGALAHEKPARHPVRVEGLLARIAGATRIDTNSNHHQAPDGVPGPYVATGRSPDGVIEAVEGPGWSLGVQWHPERDPSEASERLFTAFVEACLEAARARR